MSNVGFASLSVIPSLRGFDKSMSGQLAGPLAAIAGKAGLDASSAFGGKFTKGISAAGLDASGAFGGSFKKGLSATGGEASKLFSSTFSKGLNVAGAVGAGAVAAGFFKVIKTGFNEAKDASAGVAQLNAGIQSTGNVAHVSVAGLEDLASSIQSYSGQTDDSIVASEQLLLTFTNVRNEVGENNDIFNQAVTATADLAAKMGGDASSSAIQLGKALNDPVKGVTALQRIGVSFTQGQKDQIKAMVATGDVMGAQKIILKELNTEFGGAAKAAGDSLPGALNRAQRSFEDMSQSIVEGATPAMTKAAGLAADLFTQFTKLNTATGGWAVGLVGLAAALKALSFAGIGIGRLAPPIIAITGALAATHFIANQFSDDVSENAKGTKELAAGLQVLGEKGTKNRAVVDDLGDDMHKLASAIKDVRDEAKGTGVGVLDFFGNITKALGSKSGLDALDASKQKIKETQNALLLLFKTDPSDAIVAFGRIKDSLIAQGVSADDVDKSFKKYLDTAGVIGEVLAPATAAQQKQAAATAAQVQATKEHTKALDDLGVIAGPALKKVADSLGLTTAQLAADADAMKSWNDSINATFGGAAKDTIDKWGTSARFDLKQFEADLLANTIAAANWASNLAKASALGLDQGFLQQLRDAGPKSAPLLQHILDTASKGSVSTINTITQFGQQAAAEAKRGVDLNILGIQSSWSNFQAWVATHPASFIVKIAGEPASLSQIHALAVSKASGGQINLRFGEGGFVPGPIGQPVPAIVHGGEFVVSNEMLRQRSHIPSTVTSGTLAGRNIGGATYVQVVVDPITGEQWVRLGQQHQRKTGPLPFKVAG